MYILSLIFLFFLSILIHFYFGFVYVTSRKKKYLALYIGTASINVLIAGTLIFISLMYPHLIRAIDPKLLFWVLSGMILIFTLVIQLSILRKIYLRSKEPENFHYNFFGKKVLHPSVVKPSYLLAFLMTMPFLLLAGPYFVARIINIILFGHL